ncbi:MAG: NAD(P)-binding domain-containing protein [Gammaproteobacteria bacterium]|jgi:thioredoxin reductase (NADPH)
MPTELDVKLVMYLVPMVMIWVLYLRRHRSRQQAVIAIRDAAQRDGLTEPSSLHPVIDPRRCIGCGSCVSACPEHTVLGLINHKAELINPTYCVGHGACKAACPEDAITLVFGTEKRGVDIPLVKPNFETNVPGMFIAGELGGMGLIRNSVEQGRQAMESIARLQGIGKHPGLDVLIVGAGPAGFSASLAALQRKLRFVTVEQDTLGGTVAHFPRGKVVMTAPMNLPLIGKVKISETRKEALMELWQDVQRKTGLKVNEGERVEEIQKKGEGFLVKTSRGSYETRAVLLAIGRRGTPRKLGVPGEELPKVVYRLIDPEQYRGRHVLVVGGGDAALEAATSIAAEPGSTVSLSYRSEAFSRSKAKNRHKVQEAEAAGRLRVLLQSQVKEISAEAVSLDHKGQKVDLPNDAIIVCAGGILPTAFLKSIGIEVETKFGTA